MIYLTALLCNWHTSITEILDTITIVGYICIVFTLMLKTQIQELLCLSKSKNKDGKSSCIFGALL